MRGSRERWGCSSGTLGEIEHEAGELVHSLVRHRVVDARAHAADAAMSLEVHQPSGPRLGEKASVETGVGHPEDDIRPRPGLWLRWRDVEAATRVDHFVDAVGTSLPPLRHAPEAAAILDPAQHLARGIDGE